MRQCPHEDRRRSKQVVDGELWVLCQECRALGRHLPQVAVLKEAPQIDNRRLAADLYGLAMLKEEIGLTADRATWLRQELRAEIWRVYRAYQKGPIPSRVTWRMMSEFLGMSSSSVKLFARYDKNDYMFGNPKMWKNHPKEKQRMIDNAKYHDRRIAQEVGAFMERVGLLYAETTPDAIQGHDDPAEPGDE